LWVAQELTEQLEGLHKGVYFGWAKLQGEEDAGPGHMMVMNVGDRPTFVDGAGLSVEVHVLHDYDRDFHGACPQ
jgi:FAD synthase